MVAPKKFHFPIYKEHDLGMEIQSLTHSMDEYMNCTPYI